MRFASLPLALAASCLFASAVSAAEPLARFHLDTAQISVSGISSGAFMANQLHVAHSRDIVGAGVVAGGLFGCAVASTGDDGVVSLASIATGACMSAPDLLRPAADYAERMKDFAAKGWIDPVVNLARAKVYAFTGGAYDHVVNPATVERAVAVYTALGVQNPDFADGTIHAGHSWVTVDRGVPCEDNKDPYITKCGYDQAGKILTAIYGPLKAKSTEPAGTLVEFSQAEFLAAGNGSLAANGLWDSGYLYVPPACQDGLSACRLHIVFHGCKQSVQALGRTFIAEIGVNEWADNNDIVVLYPQARTVNVGDFSPPRPTDLFNINPQGCWNWWGYGYDKNYLFKNGVQIGAIWAMVGRLTGQ